MTQLKSKTALKFQGILSEYGLAAKIIEFEESTRTAMEAANAVGCELGQIVKSLIFKGVETGKPILVLTSGVNKVNEKRIKEFADESIKKADADFVLEHVGFIIGGIPPFGHKTAITPFIDEDLLIYDELWAAAGTSKTVFPIKTQELIRISGGRVVPVK